MWWITWQRDDLLVLLLLLSVSIHRACCEFIIQFVLISNTSKSIATTTTIHSNIILLRWRIWKGLCRAHRDSVTCILLVLAGGCSSGDGFIICIGFPSEIVRSDFSSFRFNFFSRLISWRTQLQWIGCTSVTVTDSALLQFKLFFAATDCIVSF